MKKEILFSGLVLASLLIPFSVSANNDLELVIMATTDIHGNLLPYDYFTGKEKKLGLAKAYTKVKELRAKYKNTLLLDSGDLLQGTPLTEYFGKVDKQNMNPMIKAMNYMSYSAFGVGNHEYDYGLENLQKASKDAKFPFLSANTYNYKSEKTFFPPYKIEQIGDLKVGIIGFTTPGVAIWSKNMVDKKYEFRDIVASAKKWIPELKKQVDIIIAIPHSGLEDENGGGYSKDLGLPPENAGKALAENFPDIDVIILGHSHNELKELIINKSLLTQPKPFASQMALINLKLTKNNNTWSVTQKNSTIIDLKDVEPDKDLWSLVNSDHEKTIKYINTNIGKAKEKWSAQNSRFEDTPIVDLINKVQMEATGAEISSSALFSDKAEISEGDVTIANIASIYIYENTLMAIKITGKKLREYLEYSAKYYDYHNKTLTANEKVPGYNYDMFAGIEYTINVGQPVGKRITELKYKGKDIEDKMEFTLALNNYRQSGGGGFDMLKGCEVVYNKQEAIRDLLIEYVRKKSALAKSDVFQSNWKVVSE